MCYHFFLSLISYGSCKCLVLFKLFLLSQPKSKNLSFWFIFVGNFLLVFSNIRNCSDLLALSLLSSALSLENMLSACYLNIYLLEKITLKFFECHAILYLYIIYFFLSLKWKILEKSMLNLSLIVPINVDPQVQTYALQWRHI